MSRSFEDELKTQVMDDIPDLWSRIESALPEKNISEDIKTTNDTSTIENSEPQFKVVSGTEKKKKKFNYKVWIPAISAAAIIFILFPLFLLPAFSRRLFKSDSAPMNDAESITFDDNGACAMDEESAQDYDAGDSAEDMMNAEAVQGVAENGASKNYITNKDNGSSVRESNAQEEALVSNVVVYVQDIKIDGEDIVYSLCLEDSLSGLDFIGNKEAGECIEAILDLESEIIPGIDDKLVVTFMNSDTDSYPRFIAFVYEE